MLINLRSGCSSTQGNEKSKARGPQGSNRSETFSRRVTKPGSIGFENGAGKFIR